MTQASKPELRFSDDSIRNQSPGGSKLHGAAEPQILEFRMQLQSMQILLTVLAHVARLGCGLCHVAATDEVVELRLQAPAHVAHRVQTCLAQIIGVEFIAARR